MDLRHGVPVLADTGSATSRATVLISASANPSSQSARPPSGSSDSPGGNGWIALVGGALLVLVMGGGGGLAIRHRALRS